MLVGWTAVAIGAGAVIYRSYAKGGFEEYWDEILFWGFIACAALFIVCKLAVKLYPVLLKRKSYLLIQQD